MAPLPVIKIFAVLFKEVSKPLAAYVRHQALAHPAARRLATSLGRQWESASQRLAFAMEGNKLATAKPVTDSHALSVGAELVAQGFLLSTALGLVLAEYARSAWIKAAEDVEKERKAAELEARAEARLREIEGAVRLAHARLQALEARRSWLGGAAAAELAAAGAGAGAGAARTDEGPARRGIWSWLPSLR